MFSAIEAEKILNFLLHVLQKGHRETHKDFQLQYTVVALPVNTVTCLLFPSTKTFLFRIISYNFLHM